MDHDPDWGDLPWWAWVVFALGTMAAVLVLTLFFAVAFGWKP